MQVQENTPLAQFTTFQIGGPARFFARVASVSELEEAVRFAGEKNIPFFILGGGSNVLIDDKGFDGLVIKIELQGVEESGDLFVAGAGESWDALVMRAIEKGFWGIENLSGVPGTVGGAVVQNIGAYGQALSQTLEWVEVYDAKEREVKRLSKGAYQSGYRDSIFKREDGRYIALKVALRLSKNPTPALSYKDLATRFAGKTPNLPEIRSAVLEIRANKFPDLSVMGTAGSFFKNPVVSKEIAAGLTQKYKDLPTFPLPETSDIKIPLGWFLDYRHGVLDMRGVKVGGASLYEKQFLVLVAERNSSANDVKELVRLIREKVRDAIGIEIEPEVRIV